MAGAMHRDFGTREPHVLVIIHGWSDSWEGMQNLSRQLVKRGLDDQVRHIRLGDYVSMNDEVTFDDLAAAMQRAWTAQNLPTNPRSVDMVVHSTGALVARHWMTSHFQADSNPIHRLLFLAPANFGSPQAHKGRSFLGRLWKGFKADRPFQTGTRILKGLELASPFTWQLAERDLFGDQRWYGLERVLATVLIGDSGYDGIRAIANQEGSDGTVRLSAANLNAEYLSFDFASDPQHPAMDRRQRNGDVAYARIRGDDHSTIAAKGRWSPRNEDALELMIRALRVTDDGFEQWCGEMAERNRREIAFGAGDLHTHGYQHTVLRVRDDHGHPVREFFFELFAKGEDGDDEDARLTRFLQERGLRHVHVYGDAPEYRAFLFDCTEIRRRFGDDDGAEISVSIAAEPQLQENGEVGYRSFGWDDIGDLDFDPKSQLDLFQPDRTVLIDLVIKREQSENVFRIRQAN